MLIIPDNWEVEINRSQFKVSPDQKRKKKSAHLVIPVPGKEKVG
jgi:hypothetical protein